MRLIGFLFAAAWLLFGAEEAKSQTQPSEKQSDNPPSTPQPKPQPRPKPKPAPPTMEAPPTHKPIQHPKPEAPTMDPHTAHGGHDLTNVAIGSGAGFVAGLLMGRALSGKDSPDKMLSNHGPQTPKTFSMSNFSIMGYVKGNWPAVLDYEVRQPGLYLLTVSTTSNSAPFSYLLDSSRRGRQQVILRLPARFGTEPKSGSYTIQAISNSPGVVTPVYLRVFGIGAGERAVGSVAIDRLVFGPPALGQRQIARYGFHSHADFEKVTAEFERVGLMDGGVVTDLEYQEDVKETVRRDTSIVDKPWDPRKHNAKPGQHMLQVRAWYTLKSGGDWVVAWSPALVQVEE